MAIGGRGGLKMTEEDRGRLPDWEGDGDNVLSGGDTSEKDESEYAETIEN
jgi:hypothetical protein